MNPSERLHNRRNSLPVDRVPNFDIMMAFASHFIHEPLSRYYLDYRILCAANLAVQTEFDLDIVQAISDPYRETYDLGAVIEFPEGGLPLCKSPLLGDPGDIRRLKIVAPAQGKRMSDRLEAVQLLREKVGGTVPVMGWVEGGLAEAADLRGVGTLLADLYDRPGWVRDLIEFCTEQEIAFARAQVAAGADIIGLGDAIASQISLRQYTEFGLTSERRIFQAVHEMGALTRLHICGNTTHILSRMTQTGADIIDLDWMVNLAQARSIVGDSQVLCGNFDPVAVMLQGTPEQVYQSVSGCLTDGGERLISAAGCEIPDGTPHRNLAAQTEVLKTYYR
jgi:MtaA/CmuA family methyltransferase